MHSYCACNKHSGTSFHEGNTFIIVENISGMKILLLLFAIIDLHHDPQMSPDVKLGGAVKISMYSTKIVLHLRL